MQKVYVNKALKMEKIKWIGFDMDATLAVYNLQNFESFVFELVREKLILMGHSEELAKYTYDASFSVRGAWFDKRHGNLLKSDEHNNILAAWHGLRKMQSSEIRAMYPNKHMPFDGERVFVLNTIFNQPETFMLACMIDMYERSSLYTATEDGRGFISGSNVLTFREISDDLRRVVDIVLRSDQYKSHMVNNLERFILRDKRAVPFLTSLRQANKKLFLLTNSDFNFTNSLMSFIYGTNWRTLFDIVVVDGEKPKWFATDAFFREVDVQTGKTKMGHHEGPFSTGAVYSGGSVVEFRRNTRLTGKDTLYVGDHIYGDVMRSKKTGGWRTFLIVPELDREISIWKSQRKRYLEMRRIDHQLHEEEMTASSESFHDEDSENSTSPPKNNKRNVTFYKDEAAKLELEYSKMGSLLRSGLRETWFAGQMRRYADLYAGCVYDLHHYPVSGSFYVAPQFFWPTRSWRQRIENLADQLQRPQDTIFSKQAL
ncbi:unnamed protein product [Caenorhabditis auriculariae]|uniref:Uncharacterized protein n=1 Tax=Caenorhabditis auriculariae TaxID=2777116 RepID=A0A8S1GXU1_9PELO|nr:unnamed protein product [Caenorhabditis auriculariae]